jgi:hypothetical protein
MKLKRNRRDDEQGSGELPVLASEVGRTTADKATGQYLIGSLNTAAHGSASAFSTVIGIGEAIPVVSMPLLAMLMDRFRIRTVGVIIATAQLAVLTAIFLASLGGTPSVGLITAFVALTIIPPIAEANLYEKAMVGQNRSDAQIATGLTRLILVRKAVGVPLSFVIPILLNWNPTVVLGVAIASVASMIVTVWKVDEATPRPTEDECADGSLTPEPKASRRERTRRFLVGLVTFRWILVSVRATLRWFGAMYEDTKVTATAAFKERSTRIIMLTMVPVLGFIAGGAVPLLDSVTIKAWDIQGFQWTYFSLANAAGALAGVWVFGRLLKNHWFRHQFGVRTLVRAALLFFPSAVLVFWGGSSLVSSQVGGFVVAAVIQLLVGAAMATVNLVVYQMLSEAIDESGLGRAFTMFATYWGIFTTAGSLINPVLLKSHSVVELLTAWGVILPAAMLLVSWPFVSRMRSGEIETRVPTAVEG